MYVLGTFMVIANENFKTNTMAVEEVTEQRSFLDHIMNGTPREETPKSDVKPDSEEENTDKVKADQGEPDKTDNKTEGDDPSEEDKNKKPAEEQPAFNEAEYLAKISNGSVNSQEDFNSLVERSGKVADLEGKVTELSKQLEEKSKSPFANEYIEKLNGLYANGADKAKIDAFLRINSLGDIKELSAQDALVYDLQDQYGLSRDEALDYIKSKYKIDEDEYDAKDVSSGKIQMKIDSEVAKKRLSEYKASFDVAPKEEPAAQGKTPEQVAQEKAEFQRKVTPVVNEIERGLADMFKGQNTNGKNGDEARLIDLAVPAEVQKAVAQQALDLALQHGIDGTTPEGKENLETYVKNATVLAMFDAWKIDISNKIEEMVRSEYDNPETIDRSQANPGKSELTEQQKYLNESLLKSN